MKDQGFKSHRESISAGLGATGPAPVRNDTDDMFKRLVQRIFTDAIARDGEYGPWTLQGLGMLRTYLGKDKAVRLHVWDDRYIAEPTPSELHTHPWSMHSKIVAGEVLNTRYTVTQPQYEIQDERVYEYNPYEAMYMAQTIFCGQGGGLCGLPEPVVLREGQTERYVEGMVYKQQPDEIHKSNPLRGTVTLVTRGFGEDVDHASVFWPQGGEWVTAEPRQATPEEVVAILTTSLETWFS